MTAARPVRLARLGVGDGQFLGHVVIEFMLWEIRPEFFEDIDGLQPFLARNQQCRCVVHCVRREVRTRLHCGNTHELRYRTVDVAGRLCLLGLTINRRRNALIVFRPCRFIDDRHGIQALVCAFGLGISNRGFI